MPFTRPHRTAAASSSETTVGGPVVLARDLALTGHRQPVFGPLDWQLDADRLGIVVGQQGSGRSALLLALGGRMRGVTGSLQVTHDGRVVDGVRDPRALQRLTSVARIATLVDLEPLLTVAESVDERCTTEGIGRRAGRERFRALVHDLDVDLDDRALVEELPAPQRTVFTALLACLAPAAYALLDDADAALTPDQFGWLLDQLRTLTSLGHPFIVSALATAGLPEDAAVLDLDAAAAANATGDVPGPSPAAVEPTPGDPPHRPSHARAETDADRALEEASGPVRPSHALVPEAGTADVTADPADVTTNMTTGMTMPIVMPPAVDPAIFREAPAAGVPGGVPETPTRTHTSHAGASDASHTEEPS